MDITIQPRSLRGDITVIPSKSQAHRLLICAAFADAPTVLVCPESNRDMDATTGCLNALGAEIARTENGYTVMNFVTEKKQITCVGTFMVITEGEPLELEGQYTEHPTYGKQFKVEKYREKEPEDLMSIERYLGSGAIRGVGPALAARIVRRFKEETFEIIEREPERLVEVKGISERIAQQISTQVEEKKDLREAMIFLQGYGISLQLAVKIYQKYGQQIYTIIKENPYRLAEDVQ